MHSSPLRPVAGAAPSVVSPGTPNTQKPKASLDDYYHHARNSPEAQRRKHEEAEREHEIVLERAMHALQLHDLVQAQKKLEEEERRRKERVAEEERKIEAERQAKIREMEDQARLEAEKNKPLPKPVVAPEVDAKAGAEAEVKPPSATSNPLAPAGEAPAPEQASAEAQAQAQAQAPAAPAPTPPAPTPTPPTPPAEPAKTPPANPFSKPAPISNPFAQPAPAPTPSAKPISATPTPPTPPTPPLATRRHAQVHQHLKMLRATMAKQAQQNPVLKARMGDMRRDIRKSFGQLTSGGLRENRVPVSRIVSTLQAGLTGEVPSLPADPNAYVLVPRTAAVEGCAHNEDQLPSLYLYLLNIFAKAAIAQFVNESGADSRTAEYIGQVVVKVYSEAQFLWRGATMIDMLVAKYGVMCPVLFGVRGNDKMERGRAMVGWRKEDGRWITEQQHIDRMTGLGAGFAAMTLRDFSRVKRVTPWPPSAYWTALAQIVNSAPDEMSATQCYVLKAMISDNESKFLNFYGHAGVAALRSALIDYPTRMPQATAASDTLKVLAKTIHVRTGLDLEAM